MSLGDVEKQWQVRLQESDNTTPPNPTPPNVDLLCMKPIYRHGIMDRPWLQRKRTDTLTTHRNLFFLLCFLSFFFFFFKQTPPPPKQKNKQNILLPRVRGWSQRENWEKVLAETFNHPHHHPERNKRWISEAATRRPSHNFLFKCVKRLDPVIINTITGSTVQ